MSGLRRARERVPPEPLRPARGLEQRGSQPPESARAPALARAQELGRAAAGLPPVPQAARAGARPRRPGEVRAGPLARVAAAERVAV
ncbi:MAG: hypothetical protein AMXMBFR83_31270 [Phycisphaerae bacterium]